ncbi:DUF2637 domain-containing protein [Spirillospora sp. NPDC048824]|uniref:DUF2637 domain-containing protein n=1 Tax=Spirillospora sp. NPDC048824 TaxID=3364526 RepID=UPI0037135708
MPSDPTRPGGPRYTRTQRRLLTALAGLIVAALAGGAFALTYDVLRELALAGRAGRRWAPLYPAMADTLTAMTILSLVITRNARWWTRLLRWALLLLLVSGGAALSVQRSVWGFSSLPEDAVRAGVAVAPHVMLVIAVWLWLTMFKQIRVARPAGEEIAPAEMQRGHVKVLEPAAPEPLALAAPAEPEEPEDPGPRSPLAFLDDPEPEPLIPFPRDPAQPLPPDPVPPGEAPATDLAAQEPHPHEPAVDEPVAHEPAAPESAGFEPAGHGAATGEDVRQEPAAYEGFVIESLSSEPAPPPDALPDPRPPLDAPPDPPATPPALLPTDVELVRSRDRDEQEARPVASTTRPDIAMPAAYGAEEDDHDTAPSDRAEDPDAGETPDHETPDGETTGGETTGGEGREPVKDWNPPPSGNFRSGPTPPAD